MKMTKKQEKKQEKTQESQGTPDTLKKINHEVMQSEISTFMTALEEKDVLIKSQLAGLKKKDDELADLTNTLKRLQAEFENYKKRIDQEKKEFVKFSNEELITELLRILDDFELAITNCVVKDEFHKGVELIYANLYSALEKFGIQKIECLNQKFDPYLHEALLAEESDAEQNTVLEELQKGYRLHGKVIRHAKVKIAKARKA